jgi:hypothetical protein
MGGVPVEVATLKTSLARQRVRPGASVPVGQLCELPDHRSGRQRACRPDADTGRCSRAPARRDRRHRTYLPTDQGCLYLATMVDLATRMVVSWQIFT